MNINFEKLLNVMENESQKTVEMKNKDGQLVGYEVTPLFNILQGIVVDSKNPLFAYQLAAKNFVGADIKGLENVVLNSQDPKLNCKFARYVEGADIKAHKKIVKESDDLDSIVEFATFASDMQLSASKFVRHNKPSIISSFMKKKSEEGPLYGDSINYDSVYAARKSAEKVDTIGKVVTLLGSAKDNYEFARDIEGANVQAHCDVIADSKDLEYAYRAAKNLEGADIESLGKVIKDSHSTQYNLLFAQNVEVEDKEPFYNAINLTNQKEFIEILKASDMQNRANHAPSEPIVVEVSQ